MQIEIDTDIEKTKGYTMQNCSLYPEQKRFNIIIAIIIISSSSSNING